jgi:predicted membrane protein (TIGR00267 family)
MIIGKLLRGFTDGSLATLGVVIGAYSGDRNLIIAAAVGGTLANGISNMLSAFSAEQAEQYMEMRNIEDAMVSRELKGSAIDRRIRRDTLIAGISDGLATVVGGSVPVLPYFFLPTSQAIFVALGLVISLIFFVGIYLGVVSRRNILFSALKMVIFVVVIAVAVYLIQSLIVPS